MVWVCRVCGFVVAPDDDGRILTVGVRGPAPSRAWAWGPVPLHPDCLDLLHTPYDSLLDCCGYLLDRERIGA